MKIKIIINFNNSIFNIEIEQGETIQKLKEIIFSRLGVPIEYQVLNHHKIILDDDNKKIIELGIGNNETLYLRNRNELGYGPRETQKDNFGALLSSPMVKSMLKNKDSMKNLLESLPGMKKEMEKNPDLRMMMNSSLIYDEMEKIAENPEYMDQQLKNVDLAMQKLENIPGGLNMMNSMMKDLRDPLSSIMEGQHKFKINSKKLEVPDSPTPNPWKRNEINYVILYKNQLEILRNCGFRDLKKNIEFLKKNNGDVDIAMVELAEYNEKNQK